MHSLLVKWECISECKIENKEEGLGWALKVSQLSSKKSSVIRIRNQSLSKRFQALVSGINFLLLTIYWLASHTCCNFPEIALRLSNGLQHLNLCIIVSAKCYVVWMNVHFKNILADSTNWRSHLCKVTCPKETQTKTKSISTIPFKSLTTKHSKKYSDRKPYPV